MNNELVECFKLLKCYKYKLTKQQYKTLKGQLIANDINEFGINKPIDVTKRRKNYGK